MAAVAMVVEMAAAAVLDQAMVVPVPGMVAAVPVAIIQGATTTTTTTATAMVAITSMAATH